MKRRASKRPRVERFGFTRLAALSAVLLAACTQDDPVGIGDDLLPPDAVRTFEIVLDGDEYLVWDTAFGLYSEPENADYLQMANEYEGVLNSRALLRYNIPTTLLVRDAADSLRVDSMATFFEGSIRLLVDTAASTPAPAVVELYHTTEEWDRSSAGWTFRIDTLGTQLPWSVPGGAPGELITSATYTAGSDSIVLGIDSATIAAWADTTDVTRGGLVVVATTGARIRTLLPALRLKGRSVIDPDTVVDVAIAPVRTFIFEPDPPDTASVPRVAGTPQWRTLLRLRERLDTLTVPCPGEPGCRVALGDVVINHAALLLQPVPSPTGFAPEFPIEVALHAGLEPDRLPLERTPLTESIGTSPLIPVSSFTDPGAPIVELPLTAALRLLTESPGEDNEDDEDRFVPSFLALLSSGIATPFGFGTFETMPDLRLILTITRELRLP